MNTQQRKQILFIITSFAIISFLSLISQFYISKGIICGYVEILPYLLPLSFILGTATTILFEEKQDCRKTIYKTLKKILNNDEKIVLEHAFNKKTQAEVSKILGKIKTTRIVAKLENMGIIKRKKKGMTYILDINEKLYR